jgi:hypothetical protein
MPRQAGSCLSCQTLGGAEANRSRMSAFAKNVLKSEGRSPLYAFGTCGRLVWAVRPLAASAPLADLGANEMQGRAKSGNCASFRAGRLTGLYSSSLVFCRPLPLGAYPGRRFSGCSQVQRSLPFGRDKRAFAGNAASTRMQAQVVHRAPPNCSIERTRPVKPGRASHVKR